MIGAANKVHSIQLGGATSSWDVRARGMLRWQHWASLKGLNM